MSRESSAPMTSNADVSDATTARSNPTPPMTRGFTPHLSRAAISLSFVSITIEYAPDMESWNFLTASTSSIVPSASLRTCASFSVIVTLPSKNIAMSSETYPFIARVDTPPTPTLPFSPDISSEASVSWTVPVFDIECTLSRSVIAIPKLSCPLDWTASI